MKYLNRLQLNFFFNFKKLLLEIHSQGKLGKTWWSVDSLTRLYIILFLHICLKAYNFPIVKKYTRKVWILNKEIHNTYIIVKWKLKKTETENLFIQTCPAPVRTINKNVQF